MAEKRQIEFTKMQGCGNDYVYINGFTEKIEQEKKPEVVRMLSDRHFGVGGDGFQKGFGGIVENLNLA